MKAILSPIGVEVLSKLEAVFEDAMVSSNLRADILNFHACKISGVRIQLPVEHTAPDQRLPSHSLGPSVSEVGHQTNPAGVQFIWAHTYKIVIDYQLLTSLSLVDHNTISHNTI